MRFTAFSKSAVFGLAIILSSSAFASAKGSLQLSNPVTINGTTLKPGDYKVAWDGDGPDVQVSIMQGKNVLAKIPAHVVALQTAASNDAAVTRPNAGGPNTLAGMRFSGKKMALEFGDAEGGMKASGASQ